ncbi:MAG TPA: FIST N-terminal domain-containing protein [Acidimicrobiia bacterium]|jgi:small ligand-binding sensory domain FIST
MGRFASALSRHPVASHAVGETAGAAIEALDAEDPDLVVCFASPHFVGAFDDMTNALRNLLSPRVLVGMTVVAVIGAGQEIEEGPAFSLFAARLPSARLTPLHLDVERTPDGAAIVGWPELDEQDAPATLVLLGDPFSFPVDALLRRLNVDRPGLAVIGGMASAARGPGGNRMVVDDSVVDRGAVGVMLSGTGVDTVVSQGCRPIGNPYVVTESDEHLVGQLAGRPALERLRELAASSTDEERALLQQGLHLGVVVDEHRADFGRGDFLVRNLVGGDRETGAIAVGEEIPIGRTVQFHVRDAAAADEDLRALLAGEHAEAALLFTCNGRGRRLFGVADHDAGVLAELLGPVPAAGGFCAGEIGPVGGQSFLHGFTASVALFH